MANTCPYLGLLDDPNTSANFPSSVNACHALHPPFAVTLAYQSHRCLSDNHTDCPGFITGWEGGVPKSIRQSRSVISKFGARKLFFAALTVIILSILILGFAGLIPGLSLPFTETQEQETPAVIVTRTKTPSPSHSPSSTFQIVIIEDTNTPTSSPTITISPSSTITSTITQTATITHTATITNTATNTFLPLWTQTATQTPRPNNPTSPPPTQVNPSSTSTITPSATSSETPTPTLDKTERYKTNISIIHTKQALSQTPTLSATPSPSITITQTTTNTGTVTQTPTSTATPTSTEETNEP